MSLTSFLLEDVLIGSREREKEGEGEGEKQQSVASRMHPDRDQTCNPGRCTDWESNLPPSACGTTPNPEPHSQGCGVESLYSQLAGRTQCRRPQFCRQHPKHHRGSWPSRCLPLSVRPGQGWTLATAACSTWGRWPRPPRGTCCVVSCCSVADPVVGRAWWWQSGQLPSPGGGAPRAVRQPAGLQRLWPLEVGDVWSFFLGCLPARPSWPPEPRLGLQLWEGQRLSLLLAPPLLLVAPRGRPGSSRGSGSAAALALGQRCAGTGRPPRLGAGPRSRGSAVRLPLPPPCSVLVQRVPPRRARGSDGDAPLTRGHAADVCHDGGSVPRARTVCRMWWGCPWSLGSCGGASSPVPGLTSPGCPPRPGGQRRVRLLAQPGHEQYLARREAPAGAPQGWWAGSRSPQGELTDCTLHAEGLQDSVSEASCGN